MRWFTAVALGFVAWVAYSAVRSRSMFSLSHDSASNNGDDPESWNLGLQEVATPLHLVRWYVRVPAGTPPNAPVYLCGGHAVVGDWNPRGLPLLPVEPNLYCAALQIPDGTAFEYKFTRGSWDTVEAFPGGAERPNRLFVTAAPETVRAEVEAWTDLH